MRFLISMCLLCTTVLVATLSAHESLFTPTSRELVARFGSAPNGLARYDYLVSVIPRLKGENKILAQQLLATVDSELGLYNEALMAFPFDNRIAPPNSTPLPQSDRWESDDAADAIARLAIHRHIVMVNEAHHDAHTRELTLALLPRLRVMGFRYLAIEALGSNDPDLMRRGYAINSSGSEYLLEPLYGEIVRQAIRLGYTLIAYDPENISMAERDTGQAQALYDKVFAKDPQAKLFIHAGYSHIDRAVGNLGNGIRPMAMTLKALSGHDPLCVDQVQFRDVAVGGLDFGFYSTVASRFSTELPIVLRERKTGAIWTSDPRQHDVTVILPPASDRDIDIYGVTRNDVLRREVVFPREPFDLSERPAWLTLNGKRLPYRISTALCEGQIPCAVEAHYPNEPDAAVPADRYTFLHNHLHNELYLYPGHYRLRAWGVSGQTLRQLYIDVPSP